MSEQHDSVWAPPESSLLASASRLEEMTAQLETTVRQTMSNWHREAQERVLDPLSRSLERATSTHEVQRERLQRTIVETDLTRETHWDAVQRYVREVHHGCIEDLVEYIDRSDPIAALHRLREDCRKALVVAAEQLPETLDLPRDGKLTAGNRARAFLRSLGNAFGRLVGRSPQSLASPRRHAQPRGVAVARLRADGFAALDRSHKDLVARLERQFQALERSVWKWAVESMRFLSDSDKPWHHAPEGIRLWWPESEMEPGATSPGLGLPSFAEGSPFAFETVIPGEVDPEPVVAALRQDLTSSGTSAYLGPGLAPPSRVAADAGFAKDRLILADALLDLARDVREIRDGLIQSVAGNALQPIERTYDQLKHRLEALNAQAQDTIGKFDPDNRNEARRLADELQALLKQSTALRQLYQDLPGLAAADRVLSDPGQKEWRALMKRIAALPESLRLRSVVGEAPRAHRMSPMEVARAAFERSIPPRVQSTAEPLRKAIARVWNDTEQVQDIVANTFHTAIQHLRSEPDLDSQIDETAQPSRAEVSEVVTSGLKRAVDSLEERYQSIGRDWAAFITQLHRILADDWGRAFRGVQSDDFLEKQLLGIQTRVARGSERAISRLGEVGTSVANRSRAAWRLLRHRARDLIRIGQTAVGVGTESKEERHQALDTVASARALYARLPLIYRALFATDPISDPGLAENREEDLEAVGHLVDRWMNGLGAGIVVVHGPLGSGRTSFLRLLDSDLGGTLNTLTVAFDTRLAEEAQVAAEFAAALFPDAKFEGDLTALEQLIKKRVEPKSTLVLVDNLELLLVQSPGGTELLNRVLLFWIRTDDRVAWCAASGSLAWQFAETAATNASRLAITHRLQPWTTQALRGLIFRRHRRSGITASFAPPSDPSPFVRQRLRRAKTPEDVQSFLETDFFDALSRASGQSPTRALFEWVRAGEFSENADQLTLHPFRNISFSYLQRFENDIAFTLRAFLFHNILTVEDHALLFRTGEAGAIMAFETLLSEGLIEPLELVEGAAILPGVRYRVRRLVLQPVFRSLRERHFVY